MDGRGGVAYENERYDEICYCGHCNTYFTADEAETYREYHTEIEGDFYEEFDCCPHCRDIDIEHAHFDIEDEEEAA